MQTTVYTPTRTGWQAYEAAKAELRKQDLEPQEYERKIKQIAEELEV